MAVSLLEMNIPELPTAAPPARHLRAFVLVAAGAQAAFWLYTFRFIAVNANPMGDGMEWVAVMPFGFIFFAIVMPALLLGARGRALRLGALLVCLGLAFNLLLFLEIMDEFAGPAARHLRF